MGFRASFLKHEGYITCHSEIFLHVMNRFDMSQPLSVLLIGVDNGGSLQIWRDLAVEGSSIIAVDERPECRELNLGVEIGRVGDRSWFQGVASGLSFDLIIDSMGHADGAAWPWLKVGGFYVVEHYDNERVLELMKGLVNDSATWLPYEEILSITYQPEVVIVEKRNPRVVPYLDIIVGHGAPVVDESVYVERGGKRVTVSTEVLEKL